MFGSIQIFELYLLIASKILPLVLLLISSYIISSHISSISFQSFSSISFPERLKSSQLSSSVTNKDELVRSAKFLIGLSFEGPCIQPAPYSKGTPRLLSVLILPPTYNSWLLI